MGFSFKIPGVNFTFSENEKTAPERPWLLQLPAAGLVRREQKLIPVASPARQKLVHRLGWIHHGFSLGWIWLGCFKSTTPYHPCMFYLPTFTIKINQM